MVRAEVSSNSLPPVSTETLWMTTLNCSIARRAWGSRSRIYALPCSLVVSLIVGEDFDVFAAKAPCSLDLSDVK